MNAETHTRTVLWLEHRDLVEDVEGLQVILT